MPITQPFQLVDSESINGMLKVNGVDVNDSDVKRFIYVRDLLDERSKSMEILIDIRPSCNVISKAM